MYNYCNHTNGLGISSNYTTYNNIMYNDNSIAYMAEQLRTLAKLEKEDRRNKDEKTK